MRKLLVGVLSSVVACAPSAPNAGQDWYPEEPDAAANPSPSSGDAQTGDGAAPPTVDPAAMAQLQMLSPATLPSPPPDVSNAHADDPKAAALGQSMFFDTGFSGALLDPANDGGPGTLGMRGQTGRVACMSCHDPAAGFVDDRSPGKQISLGAAWGRRTARSLIDVGQAKLLSWDGRHDTAYGISVGVLESPADLNSSRLYAAEQVYQRYKVAYEAIFGPLPPLDDTSRFPPMTAAVTGCQGTVTYTPEPTCSQIPHGVPGDGAEFDGMAYADRQAVTVVAVNMGKAIGAYLRLLNGGPSRFDAWMHGQSDALDASEQRGAQLFVGAGGCVACHSGPYLSDGRVHNIGLQATAVSPIQFIDANDQGALIGIQEAIGDPLNISGQFSDGNDGRLPPTVNPLMNGAFFTPRLRGVSKQPSFMNTGQLTTLTQVVEFFNSGGSSAGYPGTSEIGPLGLSAQDVADLVAFLGSLDGTAPAASLLSAPSP